MINKNYFNREFFALFSGFSVFASERFVRGALCDRSPGLGVGVQTGMSCVECFGRWPPNEIWILDMS